MIDLNADVGEGASNDAALLKLVDRANIACGAHAGDPVTMRRTLETALAEGVIVGAHPGYPDREHFGRRELNLAVVELSSHLHYQVGGLCALARIVGVPVKYLKPHGALYNQAMRDETLARVVAVVAYLNGLELMGLPDSELQNAANFLKIPYLREGFADRRYQADGTLVPRTEPQAMIDDEQEACSQVERLFVSGTVDTVCIHGDTATALRFAESLRSHFRKQS